MASVPSDRWAERGHNRVPSSTTRANLTELTEHFDSRIRELGQLRQAALDRARTYRSHGQLVPGSLREEITENGQQLQQALDSYAETRQRLLTYSPNK